MAADAGKELASTCVGICHLCLEQDTALAFRTTYKAELPNVNNACGHNWSVPSHVVLPDRNNGDFTILLESHRREIVCLCLACHMVMVMLSKPQQAAMTIVTMLPQTSNLPWLISLHACIHGRRSVEPFKSQSLRMSVDIEVSCQ